MWEQIFKSLPGLADSLTMRVMAELEAQDLIEMDDADPTYLRVIGCSETLNLIRSYRLKYGLDISKWEAPEGSSHGEILLREVLLKRKGQWKFPYEHEELCHCRAISAYQVDQVIIAGAHDSEVVTRLTSASSACGTCRPEVEKLIAFRLRP